MADRNSPTFDVGHPAPHRGEVSLWFLYFGLGGAALFWILQIVILSGFAGTVCLGDAGRVVADPDADWLLAVLVATNLAAIVLAVLSTAAAWRALHKTRREDGSSFGSLMEAGEGRTRFIAMWGVWAGILFIIAIGFNTIAVFWGGLCAF